MLGPPKVCALDQPVTVSLDTLVAPDNFYRHLAAALDLSFVRDWVADCYATRGRPSIDPVVFFKLQLILFFEGLRSERRLMQTVALNLAHRWYLGYALDEDLPDHSSLTRILQRLGIGIFEPCRRRQRPDGRFRRRRLELPPQGLLPALRFQPRYSLDKSMA